MPGRGVHMGSSQEAGEVAHRSRLQASAAALVRLQAEQADECCHSLLFHANLLGATVQMLINSGQCAAAQRLLAAASHYATGLSVVSRGTPHVGTPLSTPHHFGMAAGVNR